MSVLNNVTRVVVSINGFCLSYCGLTVVEGGWLGGLLGFNHAVILWLLGLREKITFADQ